MKGRRERKPLQSDAKAVLPCTISARAEAEAETEAAAAQPRPDQPRAGQTRIEAELK